MSKITLFSSALLAAALMVGAPQTGFAAGEDTPPKTTNTTKKCKEGKVYDAQSKKCLAVESHNFSDDQLYLAAREMAYAGQYQNALHVLDSAQNQNDPRILNYRGFTNRKLGNHAVAMQFYEAALSINPDYILARSYMGQGLLAHGDAIGARAQLAEIRTRGGRNTWSYTALALALRGVPSNY
ncbi:tetratricopeptide repeat protein [Planktotalea arctica]|uniref:tetratricopeptide repeat protein n=1 Tax=Planktotalea arctica TaxID=1481893 RepID=UPI000A1751EC|nr:tetratricopeptide repeat protein [Planktotalea arctica]